jgi:hypothetical protein
MTSRERVREALEHGEPDRVPLDLGASAVTGMHVSSVYALRQALRLDRPETPVKVVEPYQMLGEIAPDLLDALGVDVVGLGAARNLFGFENRGWKEWKTFSGTPVLVPEAFPTVAESDGSLLMYPEGDRSVRPSGRMPKGGWYFDSIVRQPPLDDGRLDPADNLEEFLPVSAEDLAWFTSESKRLRDGSDRAILASFGGTAFGDIALVPAPWLKEPKGIRDIEEWYVSTVSRRDYVRRVFERQCGIALANLEKIAMEVGDRIAAVFITGTDFGTQTGPFISPQSYRDLYMPFHKEVNGWVHAHTGWKTFLHSCGSIAALIPHFIEAGFDILNPVQCSAAGMDPRSLKDRFGDRVSFWGGGVDTQRTLPFGKPEDVRREVKERIEVLGRGGGLVFNTVHNVQAGVPAENLLALYEAVRDFGRYR